MKILIAEDGKTSRIMLQAIIKKWGFEPIAVEDGEYAWDVLQEDIDPPRLLLLDWEMPRLNGTDLCRRIRELETQDPAYIILLTGRTDTGDIVEGLQSGANDYVSKPFDQAELQARLQVGQRVLKLQDELHRARDELAAEHDVIETILNKMRTSTHFSQKHIRDIQAPVERTSGDILLNCFKPDGVQHLMLGDFTGHGITAAIGGPGVSDTFYAMTNKGLPMQAVVNEMNRYLCEKMPTGLFLAAIFIEVSADRKSIIVWNCGMQDVLIFRQEKLLQKLPSENLALGIAEIPMDVIADIKVKKGDRVFAYSDGIPEAMNHEKEFYGVDRMIEEISKLISSGEALGALSDAVHDFCGGGDQEDDITLAELTC